MKIRVKEGRRGKKTRTDELWDKWYRNEPFTEAEREEAEPLGVGFPPLPVPTIEWAEANGGPPFLHTIVDREFPRLHPSAGEDQSLVGQIIYTDPESIHRRFERSHRELFIVMVLGAHYEKMRDEALAVMSRDALKAALVKISARPDRYKWQLSRRMWLLVLKLDQLLYRREREERAWREIQVAVEYTRRNPEASSIGLPATMDGIDVRKLQELHDSGGLDPMTTQAIEPMIALSHAMQGRRRAAIRAWTWYGLPHAGSAMALEIAQRQ